MEDHVLLILQVEETSQITHAQKGSFVVKKAGGVAS